MNNGIFDDVVSKPLVDWVYVEISICKSQFGLSRIRKILNWIIAIFSWVFDFSP